jgi:predicted NBD/HSP70 family sugar kinase
MDHLFAALNSNDNFAKEIIDDVIKWFALGLSNVIVVYDPQMIIIQGIYVNAGEYFLNNLRHKIKELSLPRVEKNVVIEYSKLGWERGVIGGAAYVCWDYFEREEVYRGVPIEIGA